MCGIVGALSAAPVERKLIEAMRDRLAHRGPDDAGIWRSEDHLICLGHRRLSIIDLSPEASQPFISCDGRFVITFNGEIYNFQSLREELIAEGVRFHTRSDTEVLLESFRYWGEGCLQRLSGMFAFAIWDKSSRQLFCARDRVGEKPFYYAMVGNSFIFASELKALLLWPGFSRKINYPALIDYFSYGFVTEPGSIWEGAQKLPPGHSMFVSLEPEGSPVVGRPTAYWDMEFDPDYRVADWGPRIRETLQKASKEMAFADVPVGTFLSGGVDSSSVTAALCKAGCAVNTFTVGFHEAEFDERPWAREVARLYGTTHTEREVCSDDVLADFKKMLWHYDEPFNDYSYLPTFQVCREARKTISVALSGDGGDEMFAGYLKYQRLGMRQQVQQFLPKPLAHLFFAGAQAFFPETSRFRRTLSQYGTDSSAMLNDMLTNGFPLSTLRSAARGPLATALKNYSPVEKVISLLQKAPPEQVGLINSMRYLDLKLTLAGDILVKVDRASMAVSLEVRPVYLHREVIALAEKIPASLLADRNHSKEALKSALCPWLPNSILYRKKMGFAMPLKSWINGGLRGLFTENGKGSLFDDMIDTTLLERMMKMHSSGTANLTSMIHSLVFLKNWLVQWA